MTYKTPLEERQAHVYAYTTIAQAYRRAAKKYVAAGMPEAVVDANIQARANEKKAAQWQRSILRNM